jgi:hypothetical protein
MPCHVEGCVCSRKSGFSWSYFGLGIVIGTLLMLFVIGVKWWW